MELTITLTEDQEKAVTKAHGSLDYLSTYATAYADHLIAKQAADDRSNLIKVLTAKTDVELKAAAAPILAAEKARADAEAQPK